MLSSSFFYLLLFAQTGVLYGVELSAAPQGYSCNKNGWDAPQYCLCNKGERIVKFASVHNGHHEDRQWDLGCKAIPGLTFSGDKWISITPGNGWDAPQEWNGVASDSFLVGFSSHHNSRREDRIYSFFTARSDIITLQHCSRWTTLNDYDRPIDLQLGDDEVIAGVKSIHNNHHEDRRFSVITCKIDAKTGVLTSPNFPGQYPNNLKKTETIEVEPRKKVSLEFIEFNIEYHRRCTWDHLTIMDGDGTILMERACGYPGSFVIGGVKRSSLPVVRSRTNKVKLIFKTDSWVTRSGWSVRWTAAHAGSSVELQPVKAILSSTLGGINSDFRAARCIDGDTGHDHGPGGHYAICHTKNDPCPWIAIDFGKTVTVHRIEIFNRRGCCGSRTRNVDVYISNMLPTSSSQMFSGHPAFQVFGHFSGPATNGEHITISDTSSHGTFGGRYAIVQMDNGGEPLNLKEVKVFGRARSPIIIHTVSP